MFSAFERIRPASALVARVVLGVIMVVHGAHQGSASNDKCQVLQPGSLR